MKSRTIHPKLLHYLVVLVVLATFSSVSAQTTIRSTADNGNQNSVRPRRTVKVVKLYPTISATTRSPKDAGLLRSGVKQPKATLFYSSARSETNVSPAKILSEKTKSVSTSDVDKLEKRAFDLLNAERRRAGLKNLDYCAETAKIARLHSEDMARNNFFSHFSPNGESVVERARKSDIRFAGIGENISFSQGFEDPIAFAVERFMNSPRHRASLLSSEWTTSGIGISRTSDGKFYITQVFVRR